MRYIRQHFLRGDLRPSEIRSHSLPVRQQAIDLRAQFLKDRIVREDHDLLISVRLADLLQLLIHLPYLCCVPFLKANR